MTSMLLSRIVAKGIIAPRVFAATRASTTRFHLIPNQSPRRTLVMVTKTSASDTPLPPIQVVTNNSDSNNLSIDTNELHITDSCMRRIQALADKRNIPLNEIYLRVYVDAGGCSGFQYKFEMTKDEDEAVEEEEDTVFESSSGARVVVDASSLELMQGSTIDFVQEMIKSAFAVVDNPKSESACGCGSSFAIKNFEANPALD